MTVRFGWGAAAIEEHGPLVDAIVVVDVLSFSTAVDVAVGRGAIVYPYRWRDASAEAFATEKGAVLARPRGDGEYSLSPGSLATLSRGASIVLPSPNGATLSLAASAHALVIAGCLRNASAVAAALAAVSSTLVVAAGEHWPTGEWRRADEDLLGAGAIASHFDRERWSVEARAAVDAFEAARDRLHDAIARSISGRELVDAGYAADVASATALDASPVVPRFNGEAFG